jgi:hypothetical protein
MTIISLPIHENIKLAIAQLELSNNKIILMAIMEYMVDRCLSLRNVSPPPYLPDYSSELSAIEYQLSSLTDAIDWYVPHILNQLEINGLVSPYVISVNDNNVHITNKEEYRQN